MVAVKEGIVPIPLAGSPIAVLLFSQLNCVPGVGPVKLIGFVIVPEQTTNDGIGVTSGVGFTVIVKLLDVPMVTPSVGVTVMVATITLLVKLEAVNALMLPVPLAARPIEGVVLVQLKVVPGTVLEKNTVEVPFPLQTV